MLHVPIKQPMKTALVIFLCAVFFFLAIGLTLFSSNVYHAVSVDSETCDTTRTALSYLVNRIRQSDAQSQITVTVFDTLPALQISQTIDDTAYITYFYCYNHALCELFIPANTDFTAADGIPLLALQAVDFQTMQGILTISVTADSGQTTAVSLAPRCGLEVSS